MSFKSAKTLLLTLLITVLSLWQSKSLHGQSLANTSWTYYDSTDSYLGNLQFYANSIFLINSSSSGLLQFYQDSISPITMWNDPAGICGILIGSYTKLIQNDTLRFNRVSDHCSIRSDFFRSGYGVRLISSLKAESKKSTFKIYPNPTSGQIQLKFDSEMIGSIISIKTIEGKLIKVNTINSESQWINIDGPKGIYFIEIRGVKGVISEKVILQ